MRDRERWKKWIGPVAVALWVISVVVVNSGSVPAEDATEAEYLAYVEAHATTILVGGWIFMAGCAAFLWFAVALRERLAAAEGGSGPFSTAAFVGAVLVGALMMLTPGGEIAAAIIADEQEISASAVAALRHLGEAYLSAATFAATLLMIGSAVVALRTGLFPRAWAWFSSALAVVLVIGPIGWAALLLGLPIWVIGTTVFLRRAEDAEAAVSLSPGARPGPA
jgi:hypothetical protein